MTMLEEKRSMLAHEIQDLATLETHTLEAVRRQLDSERLQRRRSAARLVESIACTAANHVDSLVRYQHGHGGSDALVRRTVSHLSARVAGLYDTVRDLSASRMLRDDYTALGHLAISYQMLHTIALAHREHEAAMIALAHLHDIAPLILEIGRTIHYVVAEEEAERQGTDPRIATEAEGNAVRAWGLAQGAS